MFSQLVQRALQRASLFMHCAFLCLLRLCHEKTGTPTSNPISLNPGGPEARNGEEKHQEWQREERKRCRSGGSAPHNALIYYK